MTIAYREYEGIGARTFQPQGPFTSIYGNQGVDPSPAFYPGTVVGGDAESEFVALIFAPTTAVTLNQGDVLFWDYTYLAAPIITPTAAAGLGGVGQSVGTFFLGGRIGDPAAAQGNNWSYTFAAGGFYLIWAQRAGTSLMKAGTITTQATNAVSTATAGQIAQITQSGHAVVVNPIFTVTQSITFTGTTTSGSTLLTAVTAINGSALYALQRGMVLTGTGIATAPPAEIIDFAGNTITMDVAATASGTVTITATMQQFVGNTVNGSNTILSTKSALAGIYPNQILNGTGVSALTITSITGSPGNWTITLSGTASATNAGVTFTATGYYEAYLRWPLITASA